MPAPARPTICPATHPLRPTRQSTPCRLLPQRAVSDPADWERSPEWYGPQGGGWGRSAGDVVYRASSPCGNGDVSVTSHAASVPPLVGASSPPQWRVMRFGDATRQSVSLVDCSSSLPHARPDALAFEYVKSVVAVCLGALPTQLVDAAVSGGMGAASPSILCVGVGGGSVPLALASLLPGAAVTGVDLCPAVLGAADAMGLTAAAAALPNLAIIRGDGVKVLQKAAPGSVDLLIVDAFDGADDVPSALAEPGGEGVMAAASALHPAHGVLVINLHAGPKPGPLDWMGALAAASKPPPTFVVRADGTGPGAAAVRMARAWADALLGEGGGGTAAMVGVRRQANAVAVVSRGGGAAGPAAAGAAARSVASRASMPLPYDVGDRAAFGWWEVPRKG